MGAVDFEESPHCVVVSADGDSRDAGVGWTGLVTSAETHARPRSGYGGAIWLAQGRLLGPPSTTETEHLMGLLFWRSSSDGEVFVAELTRALGNSGLVVDDGIYRFSATVTAIPDGATQVDPEHIESELTHQVIRMRPVSGKQRWVGEYNESETRDYIRHLEGFVSASFFRDLHTDRILEYVQWRSAADLTAAFGDARFAEHMSVNSHYSAGEAVLFAERLAGDADHAITPRDRA